MESKRKLQLLEENNDEDSLKSTSCHVFKKYKQDSTVKNEVGQPSTSSHHPIGKNFNQTYKSVNQKDLYKLPTESIVNEKPVKRNTNAIIVNTKQRGNPILKHVHNIAWEYGDIVADYEIGQTACALFLSLRYHSHNPDYIHERLKLLGSKYELRVLLIQVDVLNSKKSLRELGKICILADLTMVLSWSAEEAGRYLETYKTYEHKSADALQEKTDGEYLTKAQDILTTVKSINKTDVITLLSTFGSLRNVVNASRNDIGLCPGFGLQKARRLHNAFREPFRRMRKCVDVTLSPSLLQTPVKKSPNKTVNSKLVKPCSTATQKKDVCRESTTEEYSCTKVNLAETLPKNSYLSKTAAVNQSSLSKHKKITEVKCSNEKETKKCEDIELIPSKDERSDSIRRGRTTAITEADYLDLIAESDEEF